VASTSAATAMTAARNDDDNEVSFIMVLRQ